MDPSSRRHHNPPPTSSHHHHHHHHHEISPDCPFHASLLQSNRHHHHHHHHYELSPHCPLHSSLLQPNGHHHRHLLPHSPLQTSSFHQINQLHHSQVFPNSGSPVSFPPNPALATDNLNLQVLEPIEIYDPDVLKEELEPDDEEEFEFVLTDEWKDFFAKSEAKRRLAKKQQAKRKGKG